MREWERRGGGVAAWERREREREREGRTGGLRWHTLDWSGLLE